MPDVIPDVVVELSEEDLWSLLCRELRPLGAYMSGRLKVKGDLALAMKLEAVLKALKSQVWLPVSSPAPSRAPSQGDLLEAEALALHLGLLKP